MEAFEKELSGSKLKPAAEEEEDGEVEHNPNLDIDDADLENDPFAQPSDAPVGVDLGNEPWLSSDRDYLYPEVCFWSLR